MKRFNPNQFLPEATAHNIKRVDPGPVPEETREEEEIKEALREKLRTNYKDEAVRLLLAGKGFAPNGNRDNTAQQLASKVAWQEPTAPAETLAKVFLKSLNDMALVDGAPTYDNIVDKIERAQNEVRPKIAAREQDRLTSASFWAGMVTKQAPTTEKVETADGRYTLAQISKWADEAGCTDEEFKRRIIIQSGKWCSVFKNGRYGRPVHADNIREHFRDTLAAIPEEYWCSTTTNPKTGHVAPKNVAKILSELSTVPVEVTSHLNLQRSYLEFNELGDPVFHVAACPLRVTKAERDPYIEKWLQLMAGAQLHKLLAWLAKANALHKPAPALYLSGAAGAGKSLLAQGLARLRTTGPATSLVSVLGGAFNDLIATCPIVVADEELGKGVNTAQIREFITCPQRNINKKFAQASMLLGTIRLILTGNNDHLLKFSEDLSGDDIEAVTTRFLHIKASQESADFLKTIPNKQEWVTGDRIARHALWLQENYEVVEGDRFVVEGDAPAIKTLLRTHGDAAAFCAEYLATAWMNLAGQGGWNAPFFSGTDRSTLRIGAGEFIANAKLTYNAATKSPIVDAYRGVKLSAFSGALKNLSTGVRDVDGTEYYIVNTEEVLAFAMEHQIGSPEKMRRKLQGLLSVPKTEEAQ